VSVKAGPPAVAEDGLRLAIEGRGLRIVNVSAFEAPPPGVGLKTVIGTFPVAVILLAGTVALNCVGEPKVVTRSAPFHLTLDPETKLAPFTVSVKEAPPAVAEEGLRELTVGTGFTIANVSALDRPPPGAKLKTVTLAVPALAMSVPDIVAETWVLETKVVTRSAPFHLTTHPETKFVPLTTSVKPGPPAVAEEGARPVKDGTGFRMDRVNTLESPPPGDGLRTVIFTVPALTMSVEGMVALSSVFETKVVVRLAPFHLTVDPETKPLP